MRSSYKKKNYIVVSNLPSSIFFFSSWWQINSSCHLLVRIAKKNPPNNTTQNIPNMFKNNNSKNITLPPQNLFPVSYYYTFLSKQTVFLATYSSELISEGLLRHHTSSYAAKRSNLWGNLLVNKNSLLSNPHLCILCILKNPLPCLFLSLMYSL